MSANDWWQPDSFGLSLATALVSTACWGSWSNTAKAAGERVPFPHFYADFCTGTLLLAVILWLGPGRLAMGHEHVRLVNALYSSAAGAVFGVANLLLTTGISLVGLAIAFPLCIGTALVLGTVLTWLVRSEGKPEFMFPGVFLALLGVLANARAYGLLQQKKQQEASPEVSLAETREFREASGEDAAVAAPEPRQSEANAGRNIALCVLGGVLMSLWAPLSAKATDGDEGLSPYFNFVFFCLAAWVVGVSIVSGQQCGCAVMPRVGPTTSFKEYYRLPVLLHGWGLLGGAVWALGTGANMVSGQGKLGPALSYALGQTAPLVAVLWGLGWYHEFKGAPPQAMMWLVAMFVLFILAIGLLCKSSS